MRFARRWSTLLVVVLLTTPSVLAQSIFTYAGGGPIGDGRPATEAVLNLPNDVAVDDAGNLYINDYGHRVVRKVDAITGVISTVAGGGSSGIVEGALATLAQFTEIGSIAADSPGNLYLARWPGPVFRVDTLTGILTRYAGGGWPADGIGDGGPATNARFETLGFSPDPSGSLLIADKLNNRIRRVDSLTGIITTVAGGGSPPDDLGDGGPATAAAFLRPYDVDTDAAGNIYVADFGNGRIRVVNAVTGEITTFAGGGTQVPTNGLDALDVSFGVDTVSAVVIAGDGAVYVTANATWRIDPVTHLLTAISLPGSAHLAVSQDGTLFRADPNDHVVWSKSQPEGGASVFAGGGSVGDGRIATAALLQEPKGLAVDSNGRLLVADVYGSRIRRVDPSNHLITTVAGNGVFGYSGIPGPATAARLPQPQYIAADGSDNLFFTIGERVLKVTALDGMISVFAGTSVAGFSGDEGPALDAQFYAMQGIAFDPAGDLCVADSGNHRIRKITLATGIVTTVAGSTPAGAAGSYSGDGGPAAAATFNNPTGIAFNAQGDLFISDTLNNRVRKVDAATGIVSTLAGNGSRSNGPVVTGQIATQVGIASPGAVFVDSSGDLYVSDEYTAFQIDVDTGVITNLAGSGTMGFKGDGGRATAAANHVFSSLCLIGDRLYVSDQWNNRVRFVPLCRDAEAPMLQSPAAGATGTSLAPTLVWSESAHAFSYDVVLDTNPSPSTVVAPDVASKAFLLDPVSGTMSFTPSNLQSGTTYYWKVVAKGDRFCTPQTTNTSAVSSFTTAGVCGAPGTYTQSAPAEGSSISATSGLLSWSASSGAASYDVYAATSNPPPLYATTTATSQSVTSLVPNSTYYWYIVAHASCDTTLTRSTAIRSFSVTGTCSAPGSFAITSPTNDATGIATTTTLQWSAATNATTYDLYLGTTSTPPLFQSGVTGTSKSISGLIGGTIYYWQVKARVACNASYSSSTSVFSFTTAGTCIVPSTPQIAFSPPGPVSIGQSHVIAWNPVSGLDEAGTYIVERSTSGSFSPILDTQRTRNTSATFIASAAGTYYHRVRAVPFCNSANASANSPTVTVTVNAESPNVIFTVQPNAVLTKIGQNIEDMKTTFTIENISSSAVTIDIPRAEVGGSIPFFRVVDPFGGDVVGVTLQPRTPKTYEIKFAGPSNSTPGSYQGIVYAVKKSGTALPVVPYAFVNLKVGDEAGAKPSFRVGGVAATYAAFPPFDGVDDSARAPIEVEIYNPGPSSLAVGGEVGPELWLQPEAGWNTNPIPAGAYRVVRLYTRRSQAPNGASFTRATYFTVRTSDGRSARLLVQDNDPETVGTGRLEALDPRARSFIIPDVRSNTSEMSVLTLTNVGSDVLPVQIIFTPADSDGFSTVARYATVVVPANDVVAITDPLTQLFGLPRPASGQLELRVADAKLGLLMASATIVEAVNVDSQITSIPLVPRGNGARSGAPHQLVGVTQNATLTSDLVLVETTGIDGAEVSISLFDSSGVLVGEARRTLLRHGQTRIANVVAALGGGSSLERGRIHISVVSGAGTIAGVLETTNGTHFGAVASEPLVTTTGAAKAALREARGLPAPIQGSVATAVAIPFAATGTVDSASGSTYRTVLGLAAPWGGSASFSITFANSAGTTSVRSVSLASGATTEYADVLRDLFGIIGSSRGSLRVEATPSGSVYARLVDGVETVTAFPIVETSSEQAVSAATSTTPLHLDGLEQSTDPSRGRRWNVYVTEAGGGSGSVTVRLYEAANRDFPLAQKEFSITPNGQLQLESVFRALDLETALRSKDRTGVLCVVSPASGGAIVTATAVAIENESGAAISYVFDPGNGLPFSTVQPVSDGPSITSFVPTSGLPGTQVTINGARFDNVVGVSFAGTAATAYSIVSASQITTTVPAGASTGRITLTSLSGPGTSNSDFTVLHAPTITGFAPASGAVGMSVTITGTHLGSATAVTFNGTAANFTATGETQITATVPEGATSGKISVTTPGGSTTSTNDFTVIPAPAITSFAPTRGPVGTSVTITGSGFTGATGVAFNGIVAQVTVDSDTQISTTVPAAATTGKIGVTTPGGTATSANDFTVIPAPAITSFTPTGGPVGTSVTITGSGFTGTTSVVFNGTAAQFTADGDTQIVATVPAGATSGPITLTTPGGAATSATSFTVVPAPVITSFAPASGPAGTAVTINGSGFTGATAVAFNGTAAIFVVNSDAQIAASVPAGATSGKIAVTTVAGTASSEADFVVVTPPRITSFTPTLGAVGTAVTIDGSGFSGTTGIAFNGVDAWFSVVSDSRVSATVPVGATTGPLRVTTPLGTAYSENAFTVSVESVPGDANGDGEITPSDVVYLINALFGGGSSTAGSDVNGDGSVDVADVFYLINYLFGGGPPPVS